jgi:protocatechuate 3,4-dioxygenase beta subunit
MSVDSIIRAKICQIFRIFLMRNLACFVLVAFTLAGAGSAAPIPVGGIVTAADGKPLEGVKVEIAALPRNVSQGIALLEAGRPAAGAVARAETDAAGRFLLAAPQPGVWKVSIQAAGFVPMEYAPLPLVRTTEMPPVVLQRAQEVRITLKAADGRPVAEVPVQVTPARREFWRARASHGWRPAPRFARGDAGGRLVVSRALEEELTLYAMPAGRLPVEHRILAAEAVTLRLPPPPSHRRVLQVTDAEGTPRAGVVVMGGELGWPLGRTDARGRLELVLEEGGDVPLQLVTEHQVHGVTVSPAPARSSSSSSAAAAAELSGAGAGVQRVTLPPLRRVAGRVVEARGGKPLVGALVWSGRDAGAFAVTDAQGGFSLTTSAAGRFWVQAEAPGFLPRLHRLAADPGEGETALRIALERGAQGQGQVVDSQGRPLGGVHLAAQAQFREPSPIFRLDGAEERTRSDEEGRFTLASLMDRAAYEVTATRVGYQQRRFPLTTGAPRDEPWILVLSPARAASGQVMDGEERPLAGVRVTVVASPGKARRGTVEPVSATSGTDGVFRLPGLPAATPGEPATVDLEARKEGFIPLRVRRLAIPEGVGPVRLGTLILTPGTVLRGRVTDSAGQPLAEASVWLAPDTGQSMAAIEALRREEPTTVTDGEGRFRIEDLPLRQKVHLLFAREGYLSVPRLGLPLPHEGELRIRLERGVQLRGRVLGEGGEPLGEARVRLHSEESPEGVVAVQRQAAEGSQLVSTDAQGNFRITGVTPGRVRLEAQAPGYQPSPSMALDLPPEGVVEGVELVLQAGATLEGRVTNTRGEAVAGARLSRDRQAAISDETGFYRLEGLPPGLGTVTVQHRAYQGASREVEIVLGDLHTADFVLEGGWPIAGRVVDEEERPVSGARVELTHREPRDRRLYRATTDLEGRFTIAGAISGSYDLKASRPGYATLQEEGAVAVAEAAVQGLTIHLQSGATLSGRILGLDFEDLALVQVEAQRGEELQAGVVDYAGVYTIEDLGPGEWLVRARLRGGSREAQARVVLDAGILSREKDLEFDRGLTLSGQLFYGDAGLVGARVTLRGGEVAVERSVVTDQEGKFRLEDLAVGSYRVAVGHPRELITHYEDIDLTADHHLVITLSTALLRGVVTSATKGEPLGEAQIRLQRLLGPDGSQPGPVVQVDTNPQGSFVLSRVAPGRHRLTVQKSGYSPVERLLELSDGEERGVEIPLTPSAGLELLVTLASGVHPAFVGVVVYGPAGEILVSESAAPNEEGITRFRTVPTGTWELLLAAPGAALTPLTATIPGRQEVVLPLASRLRVRVPLLEESDRRAVLTVFDAQGRAVPALDDEGALRRRLTVVGGRALVGGLPPGVWTLQIVTADGQAWQASAVTTAGGETAVRVE